MSAQPILRDDPPCPATEITVETFSQDDTCALVREIARRATSTSCPVLILGERGTGKSALARALHNAGPRRSGPFRTLWCPSMSEELFESALFGGVGDASNNGGTENRGEVGAAEGGTLFLAEVGALPLSIQPKLLRLLEDHDYERAGEAVTRRADVRIIGATNQKIFSLVRSGAFRADLYDRLSEIDLPLPPLRRRPVDLAHAAEGFRRDACHANGIDKPFSAKSVHWINGFPWSGNFRELKDSIERAVSLSNGPCIYMEDLDSHFSGPGRPVEEPGLSSPSCRTADQLNQRSRAKSLTQASDDSGPASAVGENRDSSRGVVGSKSKANPQRVAWAWRVRPLWGDLPI